MSVELREDGSLAMVQGEADMAFFRLVTILRGLSLEVRTGGRMRLTSKAPKCSTLVRRELGFKGRPERLLEQLLEHVKAEAQRLGRSTEEVQALASI